MISGPPCRETRSIRTHSAVCFAGVALLVSLLLLVFAGEALAASGSTRLSIRIDQSVVEAIARWKGEQARPLATPPPAEADRRLEQWLPAARAALLTTHPPVAADAILRDLQRDSLLLFDGGAGHAGGPGQSILCRSTAAGRLTVHSF